MTGTGPLQGNTGAIGAEAEERALSYAKDVLRQGMPRAAVEEVLRTQGFDPAAASAIVERANKTKDERRVAGRRHMIMGGVVCAIGTIITVWSYTAAEEGGGGSYVVAWGAIVFGAIQFVRGLVQVTDK
jgi:hypothetical protein